MFSAYIYYDFQVSVFMGALCVLMRGSLILLLSLGLFFVVVGVQLVKLQGVFVLYYFIKQQVIKSIKGVKK